MECLPHAKYYPEHLMSINTCKPHNNLIKLVTYYSHLIDEEMDIMRDQIICLKVI